MDAERWRRVEALFAAAAALPAERRRPYLEGACADDPSLAAQVSALLDAGEGAEARIEAAIRGTLEQAARRGPAAAPAERTIGPYRIVREIGRGGTGTVFLAERADRQYRLRVAIKVVRRGMDTRDILGRLRRERQILAHLDHPAIARFLEGGTTGDGRPYFVMQYIEGEPIDRYCARHRLSVEARLKLFREVCAAVHYAHQNLIVHRDLKPANLLVTPRGEPKLLDFGIAKLLDPGPGDAAPGEGFTRTRTGLRWLTPEYASPEQVRGEPLRTTSDVYALGVLLFRLLTGRSPYRADARRRRELERAICEQAPPRPSAAVLASEAAADHGGRPPGTPRRLARRLRGDLDTIVLTALRKEPERRYASVEQLAEDLRRHLRALPVQARGDTLAYRLRTFAGRHRLALAAAAAVAAAVVLLSAFYAVRLTAERDRARTEARKSEAALELLSELFADAEPNRSRGETLSARELLERGVARLDAGLGNEPEVRATLQLVIGSVYRSLALYEQAAPLLEAALAERRRRLGDRHPEVAAALTELAELRHAQGGYAQAEHLLRRALAIRRDAWGEDHPKVGKSLNDLAAVLHEQGRLAVAEPLYRRALAVQRRLLGDDHPQVADTESNLAALLFQDGRLEASEALFRRALASHRRQLGEDDLAVALTLGNLAMVVQERGDLDAAEPLLERVLALRRRIQGDHHPETALAMNNLAALRFQQRDADRAEPLLRQALAIQRRTLGRDHPETVATLGNLADLLFYLRRDPPAAEAPYREELSLTRRLAPGSVELARPLVRLADIRLRAGAPRAAEALLREALALLDRERPESWQRAEARSLLGAALAALDRPAEAEPLLDDGYRRLRQLLGEERDETRRARRALDDLHRRWPGRRLNAE